MWAKIEILKTLHVHSTEIRTVHKIYSLSVALKLHVGGYLGENWLKRLLGEEAVMKKRLRNTMFSVLKQEIALGPRTSPDLGEPIC